MLIFAVLPSFKKYARYFRVLPPCRTGKFSPDAFGAFCFQCLLTAAGRAIKDIPGVFKNRAAKRTRRALEQKRFEP